MTVGNETPVSRAMPRRRVGLFTEYLDSTLNVCALDAKLAARGVDPTCRATPLYFQRNLRRNSSLDQFNPSPHLFVTLKRIEVGGWRNLRHLAGGDQWKASQAH